MGEIMIETILIALLFAKIKGYDIKFLFKSWTIYPILTIELIYLIGKVMIINSNYEVMEYMNILKSIYLCSYIFLIYKYELYIHSIIGVIFMFLGGTFNDLAIKANNGYMPVFPSLSYLTGHTNPETFNLISKVHILGNSETKLKILTDFIDVGYCVLSIGDLFIRVFVFLIIYNSIKKQIV